MTALAKLLPCPFCGSDQVSLSEGETGDGQPWPYVECEDCAATATPENWNRRTALSARASAGEGGEVLPCHAPADCLVSEGLVGYRLQGTLRDNTILALRDAYRSGSNRYYYAVGKAADRLIAANTAAPQPAQAGASDGELVLVPRRLTAENGAKGLLSGEFCEHFEFKCAECDDDGMVDGETPCDDCDGRGSHHVKVPVEWTTIKAIHRMVVEHLAAAPQNPAQATVKESLTVHPAHGDGEGDIEAAAIALANHDRKHPNARAYWDWLHDDEKAEFRSKARAVLSAARPTPEAQEARDAARLDFITAVPGQFSTVPQKTLAGNYVIHMQGLGYFHGATAREAIDATLALPAQGEGDNG